jgi:tetratricopeptide (TPR) repeat protein
MNARDFVTEAVRQLRRGDGAAVERALDDALSADPACAEALLLRGLLRLRRGQLAGRADLARARELDGSRAELGARALSAAGLWADAAEAYAVAIEHAPPHEHARLYRDLGDASLRLGRYAEGLVALRRAVELAPERGELRLELAEHLCALGDPASALELVDAEHLPRLAARALIELGRFDEAAALLRGLNAEERVELAAMLVDCGAFEDARAAVSASSDDAKALELLATLASWEGHHADARALADRALALDPDSVAARRVRAVAELLDGDEERADDDLGATLARAPADGEALVWRGELHRRRHQYDAALADHERGSERMRGHALGAHAARVLVHLDNPDHAGPLDPDTYRELCTLLAPVAGEPLALPAANHTIAAYLERCLAAMHGNRTSRATFVRDGVLTAWHPPPHSRYVARDLQEKLRVHPQEDVLASLERLAAERPEEPTILCHLGEVQLWLGRYDDGEKSFLRALEVRHETRWAFVGLCAADMLRGRHAEAITWCERGEKVVEPGRTQYIYRGEAYRKLGDAERATADLERSEALTPGRLSGTINLALARAQPADAWPTVWSRAPSLCSDACAELGTDLDEAQDRAADIFEHVLHMMRGNRSSSFVTYFTADGHLRFVPPQTVRSVR